MTDTKVIVIASRKGGAGKSTLAAHMSVLADSEDIPALCVDLDPQGSLAFWHGLREQQTPVLATATARELPSLIDAAKADGVEWVIVDTMPHNAPDITAALKLADLALVPSRPAAFDIAGVSGTLDLLAAVDVPHMLILNSCPPRRANEPAIVSEARAALTSLGANVWTGQISQRVAFSHAIITGQAVQEFEPEGKAAIEMATLWQAVTDETRGTK